MSSTLSKEVFQTVTMVNGTAKYPEYSGPLTINQGAGVFIQHPNGQDGIYNNQVIFDFSNTTLTNNGFVYAGGATGSETGGIGVDMKLLAVVVNNGTVVGGYSKGEVIVGGGGYGVGGAGEYMKYGTLTNNQYGEIAGGYASNGSRGGVGVIDKGGAIYNYGSIGGGGLVNGQVGKGGNGVELYKEPHGFGPTELINKGLVTGGASYAVLGGGEDRVNQGIGVVVNAGTSLTNSGFVYGGSIGVEINGGSVYNSGNIFGYKHAATYDAVSFNSVAGGRLVLEIPNSSGKSTGGLYGSIGGFTHGDTVEIANLNVTQTMNDFNPSTDTLDDNGSLIKFGDIYIGEHFNFTADTTGKYGGTDITVGVACYRVGTRIQTNAGDRPVEQLNIGDELLTVSGLCRVIRWIGRRHYTRFFAAGNRDVMPIKFSAGALAENVPVRDLWVSPEHAMMVDGMLIPARSLVNGLTIVQDETLQDVTYIHVEFETHDLIFAEGAISESYVDHDTRAMFDNAEDFNRRYPDAAPGSTAFCAPRVEEGDELEVVRNRLQGRADSMTELQELICAGSRVFSAARGLPHRLEQRVLRIG